MVHIYKIFLCINDIGLIEASLILHKELMKLLRFKDRLSVAEYSFISHLNISYKIEKGLNLLQQS